MLHVMFHMSCVTCHVSCVTCHISRFTCHMPPVTCHSRQQPHPQTFPLLTPPLCTVGWFAKIKKKESKCKISSNNKNNKIAWRRANIIDSLFDQKSPFHREVGFSRWRIHTNRQQTEIADIRLKRPKGRFSEKKTPFAVD